MMAAFRSNAPPSPSSELSSTLVVTPQLGIKLPMLGSKGHMEPHRTNLPRLPRRRRVIQHRAPSPALSSTASVVAPIQTPSPAPPIAASISNASGHGSGSVAPEPKVDGDEDVPPRIVPEASSSSSARNPLTLAPTPPTLNNLPRRRPANTPQRRRRAWEIRAHMQRLSTKSNVWTCFSSFNDDEPEEIHVKAEFDRVVQIQVTADESIAEENGSTLTLSVPVHKCYDHGIPNLTPEQLQRAWTFTHDCPSSSRLLIITTRPRAVDALAISVGHIALTSKGRPIDLIHDIHDLDDDTMQDAWRGLLSSDGVELIDEAMEAFQAQ